MNQSVIREYGNHDSNRIQQFYTKTQNTQKKGRVLQNLRCRKSVRYSWQTGIAGLIVIHYLKRNTLAMTFLEALVWTFSVGMFWYKRISFEFDDAIYEKGQNILDLLKNLDKDEKSNAWIMEKDGSITGAVVLKYRNNTREAKLEHILGTSPEVAHELTKTAMKFAKSNKIQVISQRLNNDCLL